MSDESRIAKLQRLGQECDRLDEESKPLFQASINFRDWDGLKISKGQLLGVRKRSIISTRTPIWRFELNGRVTAITTTPYLNTEAARFCPECGEHVPSGICECQARVVLKSA